MSHSGYSPLMKQALDELEASLNAALSRLEQLAAENARLRSELADREERIAAAAARLRQLAERLPHE